MSRFSKGDRVYYVSGYHGEGESNPLVDTVYECVGTVDTTGPGGCGVAWDNGRHNSYEDDDLVLALDKSLDKTNPNVVFRKRGRDRKESKKGKLTLYHAGTKVFSTDEIDF